MRSGDALPEAGGLVYPAIVDVEARVLVNTETALVPFEHAVVDEGCAPRTIAPVLLESVNRVRVALEGATRDECA